MSEQLIERATLLLQHKRFSEAEAHLSSILAQNPGNVQALSLLAICKSEQGKNKEAAKLMEQVVGMEPDNSHFLYLYALLLSNDQEVNKAEKFIKSAIAFNPNAAEYFAVSAQIQMQKKEWEEALRSANQGLALDAQNLACLNIRSMALTKLDRHDESFETVREALNQDPENDRTHANLGWAALERGQHKAALESFRMALKLNPTNDYARAGLVEALKARYLFYRVFLRYVFWMSNMKAKNQWVFIIGLVIAVRILRSISDSNPELAIVLKPIIYLYMVWAISTWIIDPLSNLALRLNKYGRYALSDEQMRSSNFTGAAFALALLAGLAFLLTFDELYLLIVIFGVGMMIPFASMLRPSRPGKRMALIAYAVALGAVGFISIAMIATGNNPGSLWMIFLFGLLVYQFVANSMMTG